MSEFYDQEGRPMEIMEWGRARQDLANIIVARDERDEIMVSTVWIGIDHGWGQGPPIIFETMIFGGKHDQYQERYATRDEALAGHARAVALAFG